MFLELTSGTPRRNEPATGRLQARKGFLNSIRGNLVVVLCILLIPTLMIQIYAYYDKFESLRAEELQGNLEVARAVAKAFESFVQNIFGDELIIGFACARRNQPTNDQNQILLEALTAHPALWNLSWADPWGTVLASTGSESIGRNLYDNPVFQELASGQDYVVTNLIHSESTGESHFFVGRAVRGENGSLLGVLIAGVFPERLDTVIGIKRLKDASVGLVDRQGRLAISYPKENYTGEQSNYLSAYPIIKEALQSKEVVTTVVSNFDSINRLVAFVPIPSLGWVAAATLSEHDAMTDIRASVVPGAIIFLFVTIAVSLIAMNLSRRISNSIEVLRDHALSLGRGEGQQSLTQSGIEEVDDLIYVFNRMSHDLIAREEALRKARDEMQLQVQERTFALEEANTELRQIPSKLIAAQEEERKRLSAELHDCVGQTLAALKFRVENILIKLRNGENEEALRVTEQFVPTLQNSIEETRAVYMGLRPKVLEDFGVIAALRWYRDELLKLHPERHIEIETHVDENEIPNQLIIPIFRIAQEAINNASKHGNCEWIDVSLSRIGSGIELLISDDGVGMDVNQIIQSNTARSLGLIGMRERAELTGGSFSIDSTLGEGTTVRVHWPIEAEVKLQNGSSTG